MRKRLLILGAGGLGKEVADIVFVMPDGDKYDDVAFIDDVIPPNKPVYGIQVLGNRSLLCEMSPEESEVCVAVGTPAVRKKLVEEINRYGLSFANIIDPTALIRSTAVLGSGVIIGARAFLSSDVMVGAHAVINPGALVGHEVVIGSYVVVGGGALISGGARIGEGALIGAGASILYNTSVGDWATVGMGAGVFAPVEKGQTVLGNPARPLPVQRKPPEMGSGRLDSGDKTAA